MEWRGWQNRVDIHRRIDTINRLVIRRPGLIVLAFLVLTIVFAGGLGLVTMDTDLDAFIEDLPEYEAQDAVDRQFTPPFQDDAGTTQLIQEGDNVLAQNELLAMLRAQHELERRADLRVVDARSPARSVAQTLDPNAADLTDEIRAVERATSTEIRLAVRQNADDPGFVGSLSTDFNPESARASASIGVVSHQYPAGGTDELSSIQQRSSTIVAPLDGDIRVFGQGIINEEFERIIGDSLVIVIPAVLFLIFLFLIIAYRDPIDLFLGLVALFMTLIWTFGFVGYAGIGFDQQLIAVPVLLLAVGIDFGIHVVNRYREERVVGGVDDIGTAMTRAMSQLAVAFFIVTVTTVIGFGSNVTSDLGPTRNFGIVASVGIVFTFLIFGIFLPSAKVYADRQRDQLSIPSFGTKPLGTGDSVLGRVLPIGATVTRTAPILSIVLIVSFAGVAGIYALDIDREFQQEDFLPPEEIPAYIANLPEPFSPGTYTVTSEINFLEDSFSASQDQHVTMHVVGPFEEPYSLASIRRVSENPPDSFVTDDGVARSSGIIEVMERYASQDPAFATLIEQNDVTGDGIPDRNLDRIFDELFASPAGDNARQYLTEDRREARIDFTVEGDATQAEVTADARDFASSFHFAATPTGEIIIFEAVTEVLFDSAMLSLGLALGLTAIFLVIVYGIIEGRPFLGPVNLFPIVVAVIILVATMRAIGIPLNALSATILSITVGVGVAYSVHITHRFIDEYRRTGRSADACLITTLQGTGGALTGSMLTTVTGTAALLLAITPILGQFGLIMAVSVLYSYLTAVLILPPALYVWARFDGANDVA